MTRTATLQVIPKMLSAIVLQKLGNISLIPHPVASEHGWLVKAPRWIHSVPDVSDRRMWRCGCAIVESSPHHKHVPFVNIAFLRSRSIKHRQWKHRLDHYGVVFSHLATGRGINANDPSGLDSDQWIPHSVCCEILAPPPSGIHRSESSPSGSFAIICRCLVYVSHMSNVTLELGNNSIALGGNVASII